MFADVRSQSRGLYYRNKKLSKSEKTIIVRQILPSCWTIIWEPLHFQVMKLSQKIWKPELKTKIISSGFNLILNRYFYHIFCWKSFFKIIEAFLLIMCDPTKIRKKNRFSKIFLWDWEESNISVSFYKIKTMFIILSFLTAS